MSESLWDKYERIKIYISRDEIQRSLDLVEGEIQSDPEAYPGYLLMALHYYCIGESGEMIYWIEETMQKAPEEELVLRMVIMMYIGTNYDQEKLKEIIEVGLRVYPNNDYFHDQYSRAIAYSDPKQSMKSFLEAMRLSPRNEDYLGRYTVYLYRKKKIKEAEEYERLALEINPENSKNLLMFANIAFDLKRYNKAQLLIEEAMRINPENKEIQDNYKRIYPTKNQFIRMKYGIGEVILKALRFPIGLIDKLFRQKIPVLLMAAIVLLLELAAIYLLIGKSLFVLIGIYFILVIISSRIAKSMLKERGFSDTEEKEMQSKTKKSQNTALAEMKKELDDSNIPVTHTVNLSSEELEEQLLKIWDTEDVTKFKEHKNKRIDSTEKDELESELILAEIESAPVVKRKQKVTVWPREYPRWPLIVVLISITLGMLFRFAPTMLDQANQPKPISPELQEVISNSLQKQTNQQKSELSGALKETLDNIGGAANPLEEMTDTESAGDIAKQFIQYIGESEPSSEITEIVSEGHMKTLHDNWGHPFMRKLSEARVDKVVMSSSGLNINFVSIVNEQGDVDAILAILKGEIVTTYAEEWNKKYDDKEMYEKLKVRLDEEGEILH